MPKHNDRTNVCFIYNHVGSKYEVEAEYKWDAEWELCEIMAYDPDYEDDRMDEFKELFVRKFASIEMVSVADMIIEAAAEQLN